MSVRDNLVKREEALVGMACYAVELVLGGSVRAKKVNIKERFFSVTGDGVYEIEVERGQWVTIDAEVKYSIDEEGCVYSPKVKAKLRPTGAKVGNAKELFAAYKAAK